MDKTQVATELRQEAERLTKAADLLSPAQTQQPAATTLKTPALPIANGRKTGRRRMSKEARAKISAAQKARWNKNNPQEQAQAA